MNPKTALTIFGLVVIVLGMIPIVAKAIPATSEILKGMPEAGSYAYQGILVLIGILALLLSGKPRPKGKVIVREE